ncbi:MAG: hypothetical protein DDT25_01131 [Chloroflexi bacterium]|nr:hypothetical protein [Chloroflexota bacterium]
MKQLAVICPENTDAQAFDAGYIGGCAIIGNRCQRVNCPVFEAKSVDSLIVSYVSYVSCVNQYRQTFNLWYRFPGSIISRVIFAFLLIDKPILFERLPGPPGRLFYAYTQVFRQLGISDSLTLCA